MGLNSNHKTQFLRDKVLIIHFPIIRNFHLASIHDPANSIHTTLETFRVFSFHFCRRNHSGKEQYFTFPFYTFLNLAPLSIGQTIPPYIGISITSQSIWWAVPLCIFLYLLMLLYLGIIKFFGFGDSLTPPEAPEYIAEDSPCPAENQVDIPLQQE